MLEVLHEIIDALHSVKAISGNRQAELHALLDPETPEPAGDADETVPADGGSAPAV